jgi:NADH-quinone oxidoreductase subunit L
MATTATLYPGVELRNTVEFSEHAVHVAHNAALGVSLFVALAGIAVAFWIYFLRRIDPRRIAGALGEIYVTVAHKYYIDELVNATVIRATVVLATVQRWFDEKIIDGTVNGVGRINKALGFVSAWFDRMVVDGLVNAVGGVTQVTGSILRLLQTGRIQQYVSFAVGGALMAAAWLLLV